MTGSGAFRREAPGLAIVANTTPHETQTLFLPRHDRGLRGPRLWFLLVFRRHSILNPSNQIP